ncbi:SpoIIE family protein phosphatase [Proteinivorax hydrogeniformans]|uniref:SpoIIE family protein phosphatase n=1 Tax=Proteinivorax hydrogeniformans TaxID=1826727 RepID=A0AAU8HTX8_9FIRM
MINKETYRWAEVKESDQKSYRTFLKRFFKKEFLLFNITAVLLAQVFILQGVAPFVLPFLAVIPIVNYPTVFLLVLLSEIASQSTAVFLTAASGLIIWFLRRKFPDKSYVKYAALPPLIAFCFSPTLFSSQILSFDLMVLGLQISMGLAAAYIFKQGIEAFTQDSLCNLSIEQKVCAVILGSIALSSLADVYLFGSLSVLNIVTKYLLLLAALKVDLYKVASLGLVLGLISNFSNPYVIYYIAYYGFVGLTSGLLTQWKKFGIVFGFICGTFTMMIYTIEFFDLNFIMGEGLLAIALFAVTPVNLLGKVYPDKKETKKQEQQQIKTAAIRKIYQFSSVFKELSVGFSSPAAATYKDNQEEIAEIMEGICERVCKGCSRYSRCWEDKFNRTYREFFSLIEATEGGIEEINNCKSDILTYCKNKGRLIEASVNIYKLFEINYKWKSKFNESRGMVANQLDGIAKVMEQLALDINLDVGPRSQIEEGLYDQLEDVDVLCDEIKITGSEINRPEVHVSFNGCSGGEMKCQSCILDTVQKNFSVPMTLAKNQCVQQGNSKCKISYMPQKKYTMSVSLNQKSNKTKEKCGDSFLDFSLSNGKHVLILSDGMGKGDEAQKESKRIIGLIKRLMLIGFEPEKAIKSVNSILALRGENERFGTLDIAVVDLYTGKTEMYKNGAVSSYIKREDKVDTIEGGDLPIGVVEEVEASTSATYLREGDFLVMISDGLLTGLAKEGEDRWLRRLLKNVNPNINSNRLAELILNKSKSKLNGADPDDMSVAVIKIKNNDQKTFMGRWVV